jgi:actin-like protein 6B
MTQPVDPGAPHRATLREDRIPGTTDSWRTWAETKELEEWVQSVVGVLEQGWNDQYASATSLTQISSISNYVLL